jgi:hypothetical protein
MQGLSAFSFFLSYGNFVPVPALGRLTRKDNNNQKKEENISRNDRSKAG